MGRQGEAPAVCTPEIGEWLVRRQLGAQSMLTILPLQDWLAIDGELQRPDAAAERINVPANADQYWRYRMHLTLEELLAAGGFNERVRGLIADAGR